MPRIPLAIGTFGDISLIRAENGRWDAYTRFRDDDGHTRQIKARGKTRAEATRKLKEKIAGRTLVTDGPVSGETSVARLCELYLEARDLQVEAGRILPSTRDKDYRHVRGYILPALGGLRIREVTVRRVDHYLQTLAVDTPSQARNVRRTLKGVLQIAAKELPNWVNPVRETATIPKKKPAPRALTASEVAQVRQAISQWIETPHLGPARSRDVLDVFEIAVATGLRIGEIMALRWGDIDLTGQPPTLQVTGTLTDARGKGTYRKESPKSDESARTVVLSDWIVALLMGRRVALTRPAELVFTSRNGNPVPPANIRRSLRAAIAAANLPEELAHVHPHQLRKTVGTAVERAQGVEYAAKVLGHSSPEITRRHYVERDRRPMDARTVLDAFGPESVTQS